MAKKLYKFTRPDNPFTVKVVEDITIKTNTLLGTFRDFTNEEKREYRRNDISSRLAAAVMKAHKKFKENDRCSFTSYADMFIVSEVKHYIRDNARVIEQERVTVSCDKRVDGDDGDAPSFVAGMSDPRERFENGVDRMDFAIILKVLRRQNRLYARVFSLRRKGYKLSEIAPIIGVPEWELYDIIWPATKEAVKRIYDFGL
jgi:RNA polymerase sigma factor (sigma-70 family)